MTLSLLKRTAAHLVTRMLPRSLLGQACAYLLRHWDVLVAHCDHGQSRLDTNLVENAIRPSALGKKNWLFIGHPEAGQTVELFFNEMLNPDGTVYRENLHAGKMGKEQSQTVRYTLRGGGVETYEPHFTYMGFRYAEVTGLKTKPDASLLTGRVFLTAFAQTGRFACSDPQLSRLAQNIQWSQRGNMMGIPTDCPQRDERQGWLGDRSAECKGETYLFNTAALYAKWLQDMADAQKESGSVSDVCPAYWPIYSDNVT